MPASTAALTSESSRHKRFALLVPAVLCLTVLLYGWIALASNQVIAERVEHYLLDRERWAQVNLVRADQFLTRPLDDRNCLLGSSLLARLDDRLFAPQGYCLDRKSVV